MYSVTQLYSSIHRHIIISILVNTYRCLLNNIYTHTHANEYTVTYTLFDTRKWTSVLAQLTQTRRCSFNTVVEFCIGDDVNKHRNINKFNNIFFYLNTNVYNYLFYRHIRRWISVLYVGLLCINSQPETYFRVEFWSGLSIIQYSIYITNFHHWIKCMYS